MNRQMAVWGETVVEQGMPIVSQLYQTGLAAGAAEVGFVFDSTAADVNAVRYLATKPNGLVPALQNFVEDEYLETMELYSLDGKLLEKLMVDSHTKNVDIGHHAASMYLLKVKTNLQEKTFRVLLHGSK